MVKGLRSPEIMHLDLMRTYNATALQTFWKLRVPASIPFLFTSMKVAIAAEPCRRHRRRTARQAQSPASVRSCSAGSYYSQTDRYLGGTRGRLRAGGHARWRSVGLVSKVVDRAMGGTAGMKKLNISWQALVARLLCAAALLSACRSSSGAPPPLQR